MWYHRSHVCRRHAGLHQHTSHWPRRCHGPACNLYRADPWLDGRQSPEAERREDADHLAGYTSAAEQSNGPSFDPFQRYCQVFNHCHLGVVLDSQLTMADHTTALSRSCFYIRQLRSIRQSLTADAIRHWCTPLSAVASTTATASSLVSVVNCYRGWNQSTSGHWSQEIWLHDAHSTPTALATSTPANYFQDGRAGIQISTWHGSAIPVDILWANVITRWSVSPALCWVRSTHCSTYEDKLPRSQFCRSRASRVEQSSSRPPSAEHFTASVHETTENVPVLGQLQWLTWRICCMAKFVPYKCH